MPYRANPSRSPAQPWGHLPRLFLRHRPEIGSRLRRRPGKGNGPGADLSVFRRKPESRGGVFCQHSGFRVSPESGSRGADCASPFAFLIRNVPSHLAFILALDGFALAIGRGMEARAPNQISACRLIQPSRAGGFGDFALGDPARGSDQQTVTGNALVVGIRGIILQCNPCRGVVPWPRSLVGHMMRLACLVDLALTFRTCNDRLSNRQDDQ